MYAEVLKDIGMPADKIAEFNCLEEAGEYVAQERMLRAYCQRYLDGVHIKPINTGTNVWMGANAVVL